MTQPSMHAIACYYIYVNYSDSQKTKSLQFLRRIYPKLKLFHKYLMTDRDPEGSGLVTILHPNLGNLALMIPLSGSSILTNKDRTCPKISKIGRDCDWWCKEHNSY